jgi:transcriptional regulator with XRE-family HTH domain/KaiC/GvpD/RAD55 family RecA-like ATPase
VTRDEFILCLVTTESSLREGFSMGEALRVSSGVSELDRLLGGLFIGDNVVWHDAAGSLASVFCLNFIRTSQAQGKPIIYVTFDRSPKNLLGKLGPFADYPALTLLDCFTHGKGAGSPVFLKFYEGKRKRPCRVVRVQKPGDPQEVMDALYGIHGAMKGDVRFVFESLTGMGELWGGEEPIIQFYAHSCARLYELNTLAYWILEKRAHTARLRAQINQIAQVAVDVSVRRGTCSLTILKAENRDLDTQNRPYPYWSRGLEVAFESDRPKRGGIDLGTRLRDLRTKRGLPQKELADLVGVTSSTISQIESNLIYPSLPALLKLAEVLAVDVSSLFRDTARPAAGPVFPTGEAAGVKLPGPAGEEIEAKLLIPLDLEAKGEPYLLEIPAKKSLSSHFFVHKGEELGYLLKGTLQFKMKNSTYTVKSGEVIYLTRDVPAHWRNPGPGPAKLLWIKMH